MVDSGIKWREVGNMFIGEYSHNLDAKGRLIIPSKFREELHASFILTRGYDGCLAIYSVSQWEKIFEEINKLPDTKKDVRKYIRALMSSTSECTLDNQGRILIPTQLSKSVNIEKECVIVGANNHIEIWDKETWTKYLEDANKNFEDVAENLSDLLQ